MKRSTIKWLVAGGVVCAAALALSIWYAVAYNDSRLVAPMDFSTYVFRPQDLPMLCSGGLLVVYVLALFVTVFRWAFRAKAERHATSYTRTVSPGWAFWDSWAFWGSWGSGPTA